MNDVICKLTEGEYEELKKRQLDVYSMPIMMVGEGHKICSIDIVQDCLREYWEKLAEKYKFDLDTVCCNQNGEIILFKTKE